MKIDFHKNNNNNSHQSLKNTYLEHFLFVNYKKKKKKKILEPQHLSSTKS